MASKFKVGVFGAKASEVEVGVMASTLEVGVCLM